MPTVDSITLLAYNVRPTDYFAVKMVRALCKGTVVAESDDTIVVEGNHYFPRDAVRAELLQASDTTSHCGWKGTANYHHVVVDGEVKSDAAWYYADPLPEAAQIKDRIAFWNGVTVED